VPDIDGLTLSATGVQASQVTTTSAPVPAPVADIGVGVFPGVRVGHTRMFSLDAIVNVAYLPDASVDDLSLIVRGERLKFGYGGRIGFLRDSGTTPAISVSYIRRDLPTADLTASFQGGTGGTDQLALRGFSMSTDALRVSISKKLSVFELGGGAGRDTYRTTLGIAATVNEAGSTGGATTTIVQRLTRNVAYLSLALNLPVIKLAAEVGQASGGTTVSTINTFVNGGANAARRFASAGVRLSF
jgi:hypothetical protein